MRLRRIISGGQTGADQAGLRVARRFGLETGGWMPRRFKTETGRRPEFADLYGSKETGRDHRYSTRTWFNVRDADATVWFGGPDSKGYATTNGAVEAFAKPDMHVVSPGGDPESAAAELAAYLAETGCETLNVAGHRESTFPGIGTFTETVLFRALTILAEGPSDGSKIRNPA